MMKLLDLRPACEPARERLMERQCRIIIQ